MVHESIIFKKVADWIKLLNEPGGALEKWIKQICGDAPEIVWAQKSWYHRILSQFTRVYNPKAEVVIARAPARVNLIGMHIDHRGGSVNPIAAKEMVIAAQPRDDDYIVLHNIDNHRFPPRCFRISDELPEKPIGDWLQWTEEKSEETQKNGTAGDWANYVKAVACYLQELHRDYKKLKGMNALVAGNIPTAAGLGSSSALVVSSAEALLRINDLEINPEKLPELCGTAEWYVGTRGGCGDHAAIKLSKQGHISNIGFFPIQIDFAPFQDGYRVAIVNTLKQAKKASGAKSVFNERVATYEIALMLLSQKFPLIREKVQFFRDLNTDNLGVDETWLYKMLKSLPLRISRKQLLSLLRFCGLRSNVNHRAKRAENADALKEIFRTHDEPKNGYRVRGVCLYGLAECARAQVAVSFLKENNMKAFGELISLSHNGDRVTRCVNGNRTQYEEVVSDEYLDKLIADACSSDRNRVESAKLYRQPGGYAVSCQELDELVDITMDVEGVLGAGRTGAGLGGCISVLIEKDKTDDLRKKVYGEYYRPRNLKPEVEVCFPVEGAGVIEL